MESKSSPAADPVTRAVAEFSSAVARLIATTGPIDALILLPIFGRGGTEKSALAFSRVLRESRHSRSILFIVTDFDVVDDQLLLLEGTYVLRLIDFLTPIDREMKERFLLLIIQLLTPRICLIMNSDVGWSLLRYQGPQVGKATKVYGRIVAVRSASRELIGAARYFSDVAPYCGCILSDNANVLADLQILFPEDVKKTKLKTIYSPVMQSAANVELLRSREQAGKRPSVLWAGRLDRQKRIEKLFEVAALMTDFEFYFYGSRVTDGEVTLRRLPNVHYEGPFTSPDNLVERRFYDAYIHTTWGEGLPNVLLEVALLNIPIVAPAIGGIPELISDDTGYLISADSSAREYEVALRAIITDRLSSGRRTRSLRALVESRHSWANFFSQVKTIDSFV